MTGSPRLFRKEKDSPALALLICITMLAVTFAVYWQVGGHEFLTYDDDVYIARNKHIQNGLTVDGIIWAFTSVEQCNWHPVTWLSHMLDARLYGMDPRGHHLTNVMFHCAATALLFFLLFRITGAMWRGAFVAALFALHPLHVESVAWAAERKDVLSACFWMLTLLFYSGYVKLPRDRAGKRAAFYFLALLSFILGLMSKPMLVTAPVVMLLLDFWPFHRIGGVARHSTVTFFTAVTEKVPFMLCSAASSVITIYAQRNGGAVVPLDVIPLVGRFQNTLVSYAGYIAKTVYPHDLAVLYPFNYSIPLWQIFSSALALLLISALSVRLWRKYPFFAVGWLWYLVTLIPVIGLVQVGNQSMADRYMYIPSIGLFIIAAWGMSALFGTGSDEMNTTDSEAACARTAGYVSCAAPVAIATAILIAATVATWRQTGRWKDNFSLYRHTLDVTRGNHIINCNLGIAYGRIKNLDAAIGAFKSAVMAKPNDLKARNLLAATLAEKGDIDAAIAEYGKTLSMNPYDKDARFSIEFWQNLRNSRSGGTK